MSGHSEACYESRVLSDSLFAHLKTKIPNLRRSETTRWCALFEEGKRRFAYVNHRKTMQRIEVWCLGAVEDFSRYPSLNVQLREPSTGGFSEDFQVRVFVDDASQTTLLADLLHSVSYQKSS